MQKHESVDCWPYHLERYHLLLAQPHDCMDWTSKANQPLRRRGETKVEWALWTHNPTQTTGSVLAIWNQAQTDDVMVNGSVMQAKATEARAGSSPATIDQCARSLAA